jgi:hypothetical protein
MGQIVKVKVRPGGTVQFPGFCAHCSQSATNIMTVTLRNGRRTRSIEVPLCTECYREVQKESGEEERLHRLGRAATGVIFFLVAVPALILLNRVFPIGVAALVSLTAGILAGLVVLTIFRRKRAAAANPEKRAILNSARMVEFSWRAATFEFENEAFSDRVIELNQEDLMEV